MRYCETCMHHIDGYCYSPKLAEDYGYPPEKRADMLLYSYTEGGSFRTGPKFGCVHHVTIATARNAVQYHCVTPRAAPLPSPLGPRVLFVLKFSTVVPECGTFNRVTTRSTLPCLKLNC